MNNIKLSLSGTGAFFALIAVGVGLPMFSLADTADHVYVNDFSTRTCCNLPPGALLVDNILVRHRPIGVTIILR